MGMLPAIALSVLLAGAQSPGDSMIPPVSALTGDCRIEMQPLGQWVPIGRTQGLWLTCGGERFRLVHPDNLLGHVKITSPSQALEFVRLFSAKPTFGVVHTGGCVEITDRPDDPLFYGLKPATFARHFTAAAAEEQRSKRPGDAGFVTTRVVVCPNQSVYKITEAVYEDGMYFQLAKTRVLRKASVVGITHWPPEH